MTRIRLATATVSLTMALIAAGSAIAAEPSRTVLNDRAHHPIPTARLSAVQLNDRIHHPASTPPGDRAGVRGPAAGTAFASAAVRPDDREGLRGPGAAPVVVAASASSAFDWSAAGIGALGAFGVCLLAVAGLAVVGRERRRHAAA